MMKNHKLAKSIANAGWGMLDKYLQYKAEKEGKNLRKSKSSIYITKMFKMRGSSRKRLISKNTQMRVRIRDRQRCKCSNECTI